MEVTKKKEQKEQGQEGKKPGIDPAIIEELMKDYQRPRDRSGEFEPQFIRKGQKRFGGFDTKIIAMYAQGMTVREIKRFLEEQYKVEISTDLISTVTDSILEDVIEWQNRPLEPMYPVVFFDALRVKIRDEGTVKNKAVYLALGIHRDGTKEVLGIWIGAKRGSKILARGHE